MAQSKDDGAEKAYEAAAGDSKPAPTAPATKTTNAAAKPEAPAKAALEPKAPVADKAAAPAAEKPAPKARKTAAKPASKPRLKASAAKAAIAKPQVKKTARKPAAKKPAAKPEAQKAAPLATVAAPALKIAEAAAKPAKETIKITQELVKMTTAETMTKGFQTAMADMTSKSKEAYEKGTAMMSDATEFTKGNVEAMVESSKIFASGIQEMGRSMVADSKAEFEALTAEVKEMASVKSPTDFFQLQSAMMRKYFDKSVAAASKNTEAMLKLANDAAQPLSSRVSVAMEKVKAA
jgi:phasin family protein